MLRLLGGMLLVVVGVCVVGMILVYVYREAREKNKIKNVLNVIVFIVGNIITEFWSCSFMIFFLELY